MKEKSIQAKDMDSSKKDTPIFVDSVEELQGLDGSTLRAKLGDREFVRHINPDETIGGFVESTAAVSTIAYIDVSALVTDKAQILGSTMVESYARIRDKALIIDGDIEEGAIICEEAKVTSACIAKGVRLGGNAHAAREKVTTNRDTDERLEKLLHNDSRHHCESLFRRH